MDRNEELKIFNAALKKFGGDPSEAILIGFDNEEKDAGDKKREPKVKRVDKKKHRNDTLSDEEEQEEKPQAVAKPEFRTPITLNKEANRIAIFQAITQQKRTPSEPKPHSVEWHKKMIQLAKNKIDLEKKSGKTLPVKSDSSSSASESEEVKRAPEPKKGRCALYHRMAHARLTAMAAVRDPTPEDRKKRSWSERDEKKEKHGRDEKKEKKHGRDEKEENKLDLDSISDSDLGKLLREVLSKK